MPDDSDQCDSPTRRDYPQDGRVSTRGARRQGPVLDLVRLETSAKRLFDRQRVADIVDGERRA